MVQYSQATHKFIHYVGDSVLQVLLYMMVMAQSTQTTHKCIDYVGDSVLQDSIDVDDGNGTMYLCHAHIYPLSW